MLHDYADIRDRIPEPPKWFDCHGVPRYCEMLPEASPNIYADEVVFLEIGCQACGARFKVEMNYSSTHFVLRHWPRPIAERIRENSLHYGDPPRHSDSQGPGCPGETMNCQDLRVLAYWRRDKVEWQRYPELEIALGIENSKG